MPFHIQYRDFLMVFIQFRIYPDALALQLTKLCVISITQLNFIAVYLLLQTHAVPPSRLQKNKENKGMRDKTFCVLT